MDFNKAQIVGWISLNLRDLFFFESCISHGIAHRNAIGIKLRQPV